MTQPKAKLPVISPPQRLRLPKKGRSAPARDEHVYDASRHPAQCNGVVSYVNFQWETVTVWYYEGWSDETKSCSLPRSSETYDFDDFRCCWREAFGGYYHL